MSSTATAAAIQKQQSYGDPAGSRTARHKQRAVLSLLLVLVTLAFYNPVIHNRFTTLDDEVYILHNPHVRSGLNWNTVEYAFTTFDAGNWHPLTWLSHSLDCQIFQLNPVGPHYVNVLLHATNAVLLFLLLEAATGMAWPSLMVAALFALHPVNVESVAWAAERKNVLSATFFLLALYSYGWYASRTSVQRYLVVAACFALGLMTKPEVITLPFVLLLWDYWPLQRPLRRMNGPNISEYSTSKHSTSEHSTSEDTTVTARPESFLHLFLEKLPLLLLSACSAVVTVLAAKSKDAVKNGLTEVRIGNAVVAYARYLGKAFWPTRLAVMYPYHGHSIPASAIFSAAALLLVVTAVVLLYRNHRYLVVGWFWFLGTIVPVVGVVVVGMQSMADRYTYLPFIGLFIAVVWGVAEIAKRRTIARTTAEIKIARVWLAVPCLLILTVLGVLTHRQISYWYDGETMWRHTLSVTERNIAAHDGLAYTLEEQGRVEEAIAEHNAVEALHGYGAPAIVQVGVYEQTHGHAKEAIEQYQQSLAVALDAGEQSVAYGRMGSAFTQIGDFADAKLAYSYALRANPENSFALMGSGLLAEREGDLSSAVAEIAHAVKIEPTDVGFLILAHALRRAGRSQEADESKRQAQRLSSDMAETAQSASQILAGAGIPAE
jgi:protein O-mannosyl-transferase